MIIALAGQKQSGKNTACEYIRSIVPFLLLYQHPNVNDRAHSFAQPLKDFCINVLGLSREQCEGTEKEKSSFTRYLWEDVDIHFRRKYSRDCQLKFGSMTAREVMQVQGEMQRTYFCKDIWINAVFDKIISYPSVLHLISDVRHKNEVEKCVEHGACIIYLSKQTNDDHALSEAELLTIKWADYPNTYQIDNTHLTIEQKNEKIKEILQSIPEITKHLI